MTSIQIPMIFDVSGGAIVYGEEISGDIITPHLILEIDARAGHQTDGTSKAVAFIDAMKRIKYSDSGESTDADGVVFYAGAPSTVAAIAGTAAVNTDGNENAGTAVAELTTAIKNLLLTLNMTHPSGGTDKFGKKLDTTTPGGIPIGHYQKTTTSDADGNNDDNDVYYDDNFIGTEGALLHQVLVRVAATHLMGHPFAQAFIQEGSIQDDLLADPAGGGGDRDTTWRTQVLNSFFNDGTAGNSASTLKDIGSSVLVTKTNGVTNKLLQTIYEQLLRVNLADHSAADDSSTQIVTLTFGAGVIGAVGQIPTLGGAVSQPDPEDGNPAPAGTVVGYTTTTVVVNVTAGTFATAVTTIAGCTSTPTPTQATVSTDDGTIGIARPLTFRAGNTVSFYIRPRLYLKLDDAQGISNLNGSAQNEILGTATARSGVSTADTETGVSNSQAVFGSVFSSSTTASYNGFYWLVSDDSDNVKSHGSGEANTQTAIRTGGQGTSLNQWQTNYTWDDVNVNGEAGTNDGMFDAHIWKITVTL